MNGSHFLRDKITFQMQPNNRNPIELFNGQKGYFVEYNVAIKLSWIILLVMHSIFYVKLNKIGCFVADDVCINKRS